MALVKQETFYLTCDGCGEKFEHDFLPYYLTEEEAKKDVEDYDWILWRGYWWSADCVPCCICDDVFAEHGSNGEEPCEVDECGCNEFQPKGVDHAPK